MTKTSLDLGGRVRGRLRTAVTVLALMLSSGLTPAEALEIGVADAKIPQGGSVSVPIRAADAKGLSALQMRLVFEGEAFEVVEVKAGPTLTNALVDFQAAEGSCTIAFAATEPVAKDGDLLIVEMRRRPGAEAGSTLTPRDVRAWGGEGGQSMDVSVKTGRIAGISPPAAATSSCIDWRYLAGGLVALVALLGAGIASRLQRRDGSAAVSSTRLDRPESPATGNGPRFCVDCGSPLPIGARFCPNCGIRIVRPRTDEPGLPSEEPPPT